ncbi:hypothetical protein CGRA01v4_02584 [Colletotrichum graminicola]|nr:hypothetical protein CGRA01v4_02584 [Colletotrichum graminicola]
MLVLRDAYPSSTPGYGPKGPQPKLNQSLLSTYIRDRFRQGLDPDICSTLDLAYDATAAAGHRRLNPMYRYTGRRGRRKGEGAASRLVEVLKNLARLFSSSPDDTNTACTPFHVGGR